MFNLFHYATLFRSFACADALMLPLELRKMFPPAPKLPDRPSAAKIEIVPATSASFTATVPAVPKAKKEASPVTVPVRSDEHTSELQSLMRISYAVFCLQKTKNKPTTTNQQPR